MGRREIFGLLYRLLYFDIGSSVGAGGPLETCLSGGIQNVLLRKMDYLKKDTQRMESNYCPLTEVH